MTILVMGATRNVRSRVTDLLTARKEPVQYWLWRRPCSATS